MYCIKCGAKLKDGDKYCGSCGAPVETQQGKNYGIHEVAKNVSSKERERHSMKEEELSLTQRKEYVKNIKDLEESCYQQQKFIGEMQFRKDRLDEYVSAEPPVPSMGTAVFVFIATVGIPVLIGWVIGKFFSAGLKGALIAGVIFGILALGDMLTYLSEKKKYQSEISDANAQIAGLTDILINSSKKLEETTRVLNTYYDMNFIYPKYRGIVPICSIYEYLDSGRCFAFKGPDGAYNLYETEVRLDLIVSKLDDVIYRLDRLNERQQVLVDIIKESNNKIDYLCSSIDNMGRTMGDIRRNTALSAYYDQITAVNTDRFLWADDYIGKTH